MKTTIRAVPADQMRYDTVGDWMFILGNGNLEVTVVQTGNDYYDFLIGLHESVEAFLCRKAGIPEEAVTAWDLSHLEADEPGELPDCPYRTQHYWATAAEKDAASAMGIDWAEYEEAIDAVKRKMGSHPSSEPNHVEPGLGLG